MIVILAIVVAVLAVVVLVASRSIRIIREYQRVVLFRLGRAVGAKGPGLIFINPITDRISLVDLRELFLEIPHQTAITKDNASISIDFIMFYKVLDPVMSVVQVRDFSGAALNIAATTLRSVVGEMSLDDVLSKREDMNNALRTKLDDVTERWGVKVTNVEVREINPPPQVQDAMTRQMSAERTRRAVVTESEGQRQAAITVAEGQKQSAILAAEGDRQAAILAAEGERQAAVLRAQGLAGALDAITSSAGAAGPNTMVLQYLDALRQMASAPSTKFILPMELTNLLGGVSNLAEQFSAPIAKSQGHSAANDGTIELVSNGRPGPDSGGPATSDTESPQSS
ncbi:MAG: SPFH/Band 7/PHB domain protein [Actinomycetota bacterium]|nr:SPFH/Band 7/PHB domain protein [Actinomycetota bacterium]